VMYLGRIVEVGPSDDIASAPVHPYTKALLGAVPGRGVRRSPLQGEPASPLHPPSGCAFHPRCDVALGPCEEDSPVPVTIGRRRVCCVRADEAAYITREPAAVPSGRR
jgi:oligopeptide/dipeptide ABC transporter ATP-binding protein